jgi:hypothetical protein
MTVSSTPKLGHMLVLCLRRIIMKGVRTVVWRSVPNDERCEVLNDS